MTEKNLLEIKLKLLKHCQANVAHKISIAKEGINSAQESSKQETKSSAGDKHETARALMQHEIDKSKMNLSKALELEYELSKINPDIKNERVTTGSLIVTNNGIFFISIGLGKIELEEKDYYAISIVSPLGQVLKDKKAGDKIDFQKRTFEIKAIS